ncbi:MAG TPA: hypothetical protein VFZ63_12175 [Jiangellaceae bacterium]
MADQPVGTPAAGVEPPPLPPPFVTVASILGLVRAIRRRVLHVADLVLVAADKDGAVVQPLAVWDDTRDGGDRMFPAHLDLIIDPKFGEWWGDQYGLARPPETYHGERAYRDAKRALSQWAVRVQQFRYDPMPPDPDSPLWRRKRRTWSTGQGFA